MKIKCIKNKIPDIKNDPDFFEVLKKSQKSWEDPYSITLEKIYIVYGIVFREKYPLYLICDDNYDEKRGTYFPLFHYSNFFEVIDNRVSRYFQYFTHMVLNQKNNVQVVETSFCFPEWINRPLYYEKLLDQDEEYIKIFRHYKRLIDSEFEYSLDERMG
jgi:hypothetical protein